MMDMTIRQKQHLLSYLGLYRGQVDGIWGPQSQMAERAFRSACMNGADGTEAAFQQRLREVVGSGECIQKTDDFWQEIRWFRRGEFACHCGRCGGFPAEPEEALVRAAEWLRESCGSVIVVSSGVRCADHNRAVGGVSNSRHLRGKAMDFCVAGKTAAQVLQTLRQRPEIRYAYAIDGRYVHMDIE